MNNHIDQLQGWWENAEKGTPREGDLFIIMVSQEEYIITRAMADFLECDDSRILARAPKPKPAWLDAVAVTATWYDSMEDETIAGVWTPDGDVWMHEQGVCVDAEALRDVTPLIEAKVTDEMVTRAHVEMLRLGLGDYSCGVLASIITAALGLENE